MAFLVVLEYWFSFFVVGVVSIGRVTSSVRASTRYTHFFCSVIQWWVEYSSAGRSTPQ
jgi:hypothetical protein